MQRLVDVDLGFHFFLHLGGCFKTEVSPSWLNDKLKNFQVYKNGWVLFLPLAVSLSVLFFLFFKTICLSLPIFLCRRKQPSFLATGNAQEKIKKEIGNGISRLWFLGLSVFK
jgi:hypothetical protein